MSNDDWFDEYSEQARKTLRYFFALDRIRERLNGPANAQLYDIRRIVDAALAKPPASTVTRPQLGISPSAPDASTPAQRPRE